MVGKRQTFQKNREALTSPSKKKRKLDVEKPEAVADMKTEPKNPE